MASFIQKHHRLMVSLAVVFVTGLAVTNFYLHALAQSSGEPYCGNTICEYPENNESCPGDCPPVNGPSCNNQICESGEDHDNCPEDCSAVQHECGNGLCETSYEDSTTCPIDCGGYEPPQNWECGDGKCSYADGETAAICPEDCYTAYCGDGTCDFEYDEDRISCPEDCDVADECGDGACTGAETAVSCPDDCKEKPPETVCGDYVCEYPETATSCPVDCGDFKCGNAECEPGETAALCPEDCAVSQCGDGTCESGETYEVCPADCAKPYDGYCGDNYCAAEFGEDPVTCFIDCHCGNNICDKVHDETHDNCPSDCEENVPSVPDPGENYCEDSDGGRNSTVKGYVKDASSLRTDHCIDMAGVREFYCDAENLPQSTELSCGSGYVCDDGACVKSETAVNLYCGDGTCSTGEDYLTCPADCKPITESWVCGDKTCDRELGEDHVLCASDCQAPPKCGDGLCNGDETTDTCRLDCYVAKCGDGLCEVGFGESAKSCLVDCHCGDGYCDASFEETVSSCEVDCSNLCGNGGCDATQGENSLNCPIDCPKSPVVTPEEPCLDSDGGKLPRVFGTTNKGLVNYADACLSRWQVKEFFCDYGEIKNVTLDCLDGRACREGKCTFEETAVEVDAKSVCGDGTCDQAAGEDPVICPADCGLPEELPPGYEDEAEIPDECAAAGVTSLDACGEYLLTKSGDLPQEARCGDGRCETAIGENWFVCAADCPQPDERPTVVVDLDPRCKTEGITNLDSCRELLRTEESAADLPEACVANGIGSAEECEKLIVGMSERLELADRSSLVTSPVDYLRVEVDSRCYEVNIQDESRCAAYLAKTADEGTGELTGAASGPETDGARAAVPPICSENGVFERDDCQNYLRLLYVAPTCRAANVLDPAACRALLSAKRMPSICVEKRVFDEVACLELQRSSYLPPICEQTGETTREGCMQTVFEKYGRPDRCADLSDESCWRLVESGKVNEQEFDLKTSLATVPERCIRAGAVTGDDCRRLVDSMGLPEECRLAGYFTKAACNRFMFEGGSSVADEMPSECRAASIADPAACNEYLTRIHMPVECAAAGLSSEGECARYLSMKSLPDECRAAGITSAAECERQLRTKVAEPECRKAGISDSQACAEYTYRLVANKVKCSGLTSEECAMTVKEKKLGAVAAAQRRLASIGRQMEEAADEKGIIDMEKMEESDPEQSARMKSELPISLKNNGKLRAVKSEEALTVTHEDHVRIAAPIVLTLDSDADGVPDDVEKRNGLDPRDPETEAGVSDAEAFRRMRGKTGIDAALAGGRAIGQPIVEGKLDSSMRVERVNTIYEDRPADGREPSASGLVLEGVGTPGDVVTLYIYSDLPMVVTTTVDQDGRWSYTFDDTLNDGVHEVYVAVNDDTGKVSRKGEPLAFVVRAAKASGGKAAVAAESADDLDLTVLPDVNVEETSRASTSLRWFVLGGALLLLAAVGLTVALVAGKRR